MTFRIPERLRPVLWLLVTLSVFIGYWITYPQEYFSGDPSAYAKCAYEIVQGESPRSNHVFYHRLGVLLPVATCYRFLGVTIYSTNLSMLCAVLLVAMTVWAALPDARSKLIGLVFCVTCVPLLEATVMLLPDIVAASFMALSSWLLFSRNRVTQAQRWWWLLLPIAAVSCLFIAFLAKLSAYWVLPIWGVVLWNDLRRRDTIVLKRFFLPASIAGLLLGILYLWYCNYVWGDPLSRLKGIQELTGVHRWSWDNASWPDFLKRLSTGPTLLFIKEYGTIPLLAIFSLWVLPKRLWPWVGYTACCVFFFWFGTTSFTQYEPLPLKPRMTLPALPGMLILAASLVSQVTVLSTRPDWVNKSLPVAFLLFALGIPLVEYLDSTRWIVRAETQAIDHVRQEVRRHPNQEYCLICSDRVSKDYLPIYFGFELPSNLQIFSAERLSAEQLVGRRGFVFVHERRSGYLSAAYGMRNLDHEIKSLNLHERYRGNDRGNKVNLYEIRDVDELKPLLQEST